MDYEYMTCAEWMLRQLLDCDRRCLYVLCRRFRILEKLRSPVTYYIIDIVREKHGKVDYDTLAYEIAKEIHVEVATMLENRGFKELADRIENENIEVGYALIDSWLICFLDRFFEDREEVRDEELIKAIVEYYTFC